MQLQKEVVWGFYGALSLVLFGVGYGMAKKNKMEYGLLGLLIGVLISLILWVLWASKNTY